MELTETQLRDSSSNAKKYNNKLADYAESFPHMLDEFKKHYIFFNKNPEVNEYQQLYLSMKSNIQQAISQVFVTTNEIQQNIDELNSYIVEFNKKIDKEKIKNTDLKKKLGMLNAENDTSGLMIDNYKETYNIQYFTNFVILLGILSICFFMYKTFGSGPVIIPIKEIGEKIIEKIKPTHSLPINPTNPAKT